MARCLDQRGTPADALYGAALMARPDFVMIGAMKCGTSTMAAQLGAQDGIFLTDPKEPNFFSDDTVFAKGQGWYEALFRDAPGGALKGEASTHYTKRPDLPQTVERMAAALPDVRLVYMIRDPMARIVSHYIHAWSEGWTSAPLDAALDEMPSLVDYGLYGWQITPFVETWGADAICLTSLERMRADPGGELARVAAHLGHAGSVAWTDLSTQNVSAERVRKLPLHGLLVDNKLATALRRSLVPKALRTRIRQARQMPDRPTIPGHRLAALRTRFLEDRAVLAGHFPDDPSLDLAYPWAEERTS